MPREGAPSPFRDRLAGAALLAFTAGTRRRPVVLSYGLADFAALFVVVYTRPDGLPPRAEPSQ